MKKANWIRSCINYKIKRKCKQALFHLAPQSSPARIRGEKAAGAVLYYFLQLRSHFNVSVYFDVRFSIFLGNKTSHGVGILL